MRVDPVELTIEEGGTGTYTVVLNRAPSAEVTVAVTAGGGLTVDRPALTFTALDWETAQTVTVTAGEDDDAEDETETLTHAVTSADSAYRGLAVDEVKVTVADDEGTGGPGGTEELTVSTTRLRITEGNMGAYTVVLNREPASGVTVAVGARTGSDLTVSPATLDFTPSNWDTPQEVRVEAGQDDDLADEVESITHTITRSSASSSLRGGLARDAFLATAPVFPAPTREYVYLGGRLVAIAEGGSAGEVSVVVTIDDDDDPETPGVPALTNSLTLTEGHTGAYTLELGAAPRANVAIALSVSRGSDNVADVTVSPARVTFTASNWDRPQWITVSAGRDDDTVGETETISHTATSADSRYRGIRIADVRVVIRDRNPTRRPRGTLTASPNPCTIAAGQDTCSTILSWTSTNTTAVQLRRKEGNRIVVRSGSPNGNTTSSEIGLTASTFILYDYSSGSRGNQLDTVTVKGVKALSLSPTSGPVGTVVTITGSGFGGSRGRGPNASTVTFNGTPAAAYTSWSDTEIVVVVPSGLTNGAKTVKVTVGGTARTVGTFTVRTARLTASPNPCTIASGQTTCTTTIRWNGGSGSAVRVWTKRQNNSPFGYVGGTLTAFTTTTSSSGSKQATIRESPLYRHIFALHDHSGGRRGPELATVTVTGVRPLAISPPQGPAGTSVVIVGSGFGALQRTSTVTFNRTPASTYTSWSDTRIRVVVPSGATTGPVKVTVGGVERAARTFTIGPAVTATLSASPNPCTIASGQDTCTSNVRWSSTNTSAVRVWTQLQQQIPGGYVAGLLTAFTTRNSTSGNKDATINEFPRYRHKFFVHDFSGGFRGVQLATVTVTGESSPNGGPTCDSFRATPASICSGGSSTLRWTTTGADSVRINRGIGGVRDDGSRSVSPTTTTTYTLTATNTGGTATCRTTVRVWDPPTASISANPTTINEGQPFTLRWTTSNAGSASIDPGVGTVTPNAGGRRTLRPPVGEHTYTITASKATGSPCSDATDSVTVTVTGPPDPPTIDSFTPSRTDIRPNGRSTLSWRTSNAGHVTLNGTSVAVDGSQVERPRTTGDYTLVACKSRTQCTGTNRKQKAVTVTVWAQPTITCSVDDRHLQTNQTTTLRWSSTNAKRVTEGSSILALSGTQTLRPKSLGDNTYTLRATNPAEPAYQAATCSKTVTLWARPTATISANRTSINEGQPVTLTWSSGNGSSTVISGLGAVAANGSRTLKPAQGSRKYTISAANPAWTGGDAAKASVTVAVDARPTGTISASPNPCTIAASARTCTTTVRWSGSGTTRLLVRTSHNGQAERVHAGSGRTGSSSPSWIQRSPTHSYVFYLYDYENRIPGARLASVRVRGVKAPVISNTSPRHGNPDTRVTVYGSYFGSAQGTVSFGGISAEINSWSDTAIGALVPRYLGRGRVSVTVTANRLTSNSVNFTVTGDPVPQEEDDPVECDKDEEDCPEEEEESPDP